MLDTELIPAPDRASQRLMIVLHGLGDSAEGYYWLPQALQLPWMNYLLVNAPDEYYTGYSWFDLMGNPGPGIARSRQLLFELLDHQRAQGWPTEQTVLFGFSQGCLMTIELGARYPQRFAGLVGISGFVQEIDDLLRNLSPVALQQRFLITHGTHDPLLPFAQARSLVQRLQDARLQIEWREFQKDHTIAGQEELDVIREFVLAGYPPA
jgi:phospholipase/carboxylesterase